MNELEPSEVKLLNQLEKRIEFGKSTFVLVGNALTEIRDKRLYRKSHKTFEDYCEKRWGWTRQRSHQLIQAASVVESLPDNLSTIVDTEGVARAVAKVKPERRAAVVKKAAESGKPITAVAVARAAKPASLIDHAGQAVPEEIAMDWDRADEMGRRLRSYAQEIKLTVEHGITDKKDIIFGEVTNATVDDAGSLYVSLSQIIPHAVCTLCKGRARGKCRLCAGRGWISKHLYDSPAVSAEVKKLIQQSARQ